MKTQTLPLAVFSFFSFDNRQLRRAGFAVLATLFFAANPVLCQRRYPPLQNVSKPNPAPAPPGQAFAPLVEAGPDSASPNAAAWTQTAGPNESLIITGSDFSTYRGDEEGKDSRFVLYDGTHFRHANIQRVEKEKAIVTINKDVGAWGMYLLWPANENGYGSPMAVNKTDAWWVGPDKTAAGKTASVYGRNLAQTNDTFLSYVFLKPLQGAGRWAAVTRVNPYKVDFVVPADLPSGDYQVWTHNGHGGDLGWSGPLSLTVADSVSWSPVIYNVKNFGAKGDGHSDDTEAVLKAIRQAGLSANATLYFPAGDYIVSNTLDVRNGVRWLGDGMSTVIKCSPSFSTDAWGLLNAQKAKNFELKDLCLDGNANMRGNLSSAVCFRGCDGVSLNNVQFRFQNFGILDLDSSRHVFINGCGFTGMQSFLGSCSQLFIEGCLFALTNDAEMALHSWGGECISVTNSVCKDHDNSNPLDGSGWGLGRFFVGNGIYGGNRLTYLAYNQTQDLTVRPLAAEQNAGEQLMWEGNLTLWSGRCAHATATTVVLNGLSLVGNPVRYAAIVKGKGLGQSRRIISHSGNTFVLEAPWNVVPDAESVINVGTYMDRVVVYRNYLDAKPYAATNTQHNASAGVEPFGGCFNMIADGNTFHQLRQGISNWATRVTRDEGMAPNFFNLYSNNRFSNCRWALYNAEANWSPKLRITEGTGMLGTTYRKNRIENPVESGIKNSVQSTDYPVMDVAVYEHNLFSNLTAGFVSDTAGTVNQCFYSNAFYSGTTTAAAGFALQTTAGQVLRENSISGFNCAYREALGKPVIEAPNHVIDLNTANNNEAIFIVWNSGTAAMEWTAVVDVPWLSLSKQAGTVAHEGDSSRLLLKGSEAGLAPGTYKANLTLRCQSQSKVYRVVFVVPDLLVPLPAKLLAFDVKKRNGDVLLTWRAGAGADDEGYDVERSADGGRYFEKIGYVPAILAAPSVQSYAFTDTKALRAKAHYRLKQRQANGFGYSQVKSVDGSTGRQPSSLFPNPAGNVVNVLFHSAQAGTVRLCFYNRSGFKVLKTIESQAESGCSQRTIDVSSLSKGLYLIKINYPDKAEEVVRFVKG